MTLKREKAMPLSLLALLSSSSLLCTSAAPSPSIICQPLHRQSLFLHAAGASPVTNTRKKNRSTYALYEFAESDYVGNSKRLVSKTNSGSAKRKSAAKKKNKAAPLQSSNIYQGRENRSNPHIPPLDGPVGAPQLPALTTKDSRIIERWLDDHVGSIAPNEYTILGFDQESIAKPPWWPERASLPDGPATIQLSTPASSIIIQLSLCGDGSALHAPDILRNVINNPRIIKVGVGIDDDALELYRWSKKSYEEAERECAHKERQHSPQLWEMTSRFDLGCILPNKHPSHRSGIRELAQKILGVEIIKSKKLSMSNWGKRYLTLDQISYAARDAWVSAAILERLQKDASGVFEAEALIDMEFMKNQRSMSIMDERAKYRKAAKLELKEIQEREISNETEAEDQEERKLQLFGLLDLHRPDQPPTFDEQVTLPLF
eukprot:CAMPEP_0172557342 /NCGR_PEP_ID=MMETSP1067-20121228/72684_1 /TAXON_ID=265564 ORGANISM="Thalassiosira punctigera, Strain Tpunct2005C2" /NCGR_SAMPLE_ID=MMETSP1067 /ASSEMBLY_ACC=CAM_ASM_000444 /LENGTH=431 /DNA_ID=CAMNT_0013346401 /DNA_START=33 /DNA_END=1328 /DNA_ORIENTATION=+